MRRILLIITDFILLYLVALIAGTIRLFDTLWYELINRQGWAKLAVMVCTIQLMFYLFDLYDLYATRRYYRVLINIAKALSAASLVLVILFYAVPKLELGRGVFLLSLDFS